MNFDVAIVGAGPGGYVAAIKAAQKGLNVGLIEKQHIGGTCLNIGCIPTKNLLSNSKKYADMFEYQDVGINIAQFDVDFQKMINAKEKVVAQLTRGVQFLLQKNKVQVINGDARFIDNKSISVKIENGSETVTAKHFIVATGSIPNIPEIFDYDGELVCSSTDCLSWNNVPYSMVIIGGGVIGCELATIYANLGTMVTIIEMQNRLLPNMDGELSEFAKKNLQFKGVKILTETVVNKIEKRDGHAYVEISDEEFLESEKVVVSIGRKTELEALNAINAGIEVENGKITVNSQMRTNSENIYAVGDVCSSPYDLAHSAMKEASVAVDNICGERKRMTYQAIPNCVYISPEIASVGLSETEAKKQGIDCAEGRFNFAANGKAISTNEAVGFVKIVAEKTTKVIIGAQLVGPHVTDLVTQLTTAIQSKVTTEELLDVIYAHPTLSEAVGESIESIFGSAVHS